MIKSILDHCAVMLQDLELGIELCETVFGMTVRKTEMKEERIFQIWFDQGIQLIRSDFPAVMEHGFVNHIGIRVSDVKTCLAQAERFRAKSLAKGNNWIVFPFGLCVEVLPIE